MASQAPIAIFCYRRPDHLRRTLQSLMQCEGFEGGPVFVFGDGPRSEDEISNVVETRSVAKSLLGNRAEYHFRDKNAGLARSVIEGVNDVVGRFGRVIVIEDDLELAPGFLTYMNRALDRYADNESVFQVSGYIYDTPELSSKRTALFLPFISSWGWATWQRAWNYFDADAREWLTLRSDRQARRRFNLDYSYDYTTMLFHQMTGQGQSWAIRWYWAVFKANGLVLYPPVSLVRNVGLEGSGTHGGGRLRRSIPSGPLGLQKKFEIEFPEAVGIHQPSFESVKNAFRWRNGRFLARLVDKLRWWRCLLASYLRKPLNIHRASAKESARPKICSNVKSSMGWWGADIERTTGQAIVTRHVVGLLERDGVRAFVYRGLGLQSVTSTLISVVRLGWSVLTGRVRTLYLVCSRSNAGFLRDLPAYLVRFLGVRVVVHVHGSDIVDLCKRPGLGSLAKALLSRCEVIVPSAHLIKSLHVEGIAKVHLCENFVQSAQDNRTASAKEARGQDFNTFRVLWNSNLMASKGFFAVAKAVGELASNGQNIQLIALGEPLGDEAMNLTACRNAVNQLKNQNWVEFKGPVGRKTALALLLEADLVCLPSHYSSECQPLALIEAMCVARRVLIADTPALRATMGDYPCAVVENPTPKDIRLALERIMTHSCNQIELIEASRKARARFSIQRFESEISSLLGIGPPLDSRSTSFGNHHIDL